MTKKITIIWGSDRDPNNKETYKFKTKEQLKYFMMGVDEAEGWLEANGYKQQAASCKRQAASLTRKQYRIIKETCKPKKL